MTQATYGSTVRVHYAVRLANGSVLMSTYKDQPIQFTIGKGHVFRDVEQAVVGMNVGEAKIATIAGERMFGACREHNLLEVDRNNLSHDSLKIGSRIRLPGKRFSVKIVNIDESKVIVDINHPLSQKDLFFHISLIEIL